MWRSSKHGSLLAKRLAFVEQNTQSQAWVLRANIGGRIGNPPNICIEVMLTLRGERKPAHDWRPVESFSTLSERSLAACLEWIAQTSTERGLDTPKVDELYSPPEDGLATDLACLEETLDHRLTRCIDFLRQEALREAALRRAFGRWK